MFVNLNIPSFGELLGKHIIILEIDYKQVHDNVIIRGIYLSHFLPQSDIWDWWGDILSP